MNQQKTTFHTSVKLSVALLDATFPAKFISLQVSIIVHYELFFYYIRECCGGEQNVDIFVKFNFQNGDRLNLVIVT